MVRSVNANEAGECLVGVDPTLAPWFTSDNVGAYFGEPVTVVPFLTDRLSEQTVRERYESRISQWVWVPFSIVACLFYGLVLRGRRKSLSVYRLVSIGPLGVTTILVVEAFVLWLASLGIVLLSASMLVAARSIHVGLIDAALALSRFSVAYLGILTVVVALAIAGASPHDVLQGRDA